MTETCFRHGLVKVDLMEQTPLAPDIGDCPTFAVPHSNVSAYKVNFSLWNRKSSNWWKVVLELQQAPLYRIYLFSRGWFYLKLMEGSLDYIEVKHGQHMSVHLALQVPSHTRTNKTYHTPVSSYHPDPGRSWWMVSISA